MVTHDEAAEGQALEHDLDQVVHTGCRRGILHRRDHPAQRDPAAHLQRVQGRDEMIAADVVEVQVDAVRSRRRQALREVGPVVDALVEAELVDEDAGLLRAAGAPDHPGSAEQPGELARGAAHRAGRGGDEHHVAFAHLARPAEPDVGGEARSGRGRRARSATGPAPGRRRWRPPRPPRRGLASPGGAGRSHRPRTGRRGSAMTRPIADPSSGPPTEKLVV